MVATNFFRNYSAAPDYYRRHLLEDILYQCRFDAAASTQSDRARRTIVNGIWSLKQASTQAVIRNKRTWLYARDAAIARFTINSIPGPGQFVPVQAPSPSFVAIIRYLDNNHSAIAIVINVICKFSLSGNDQTGIITIIEINHTIRDLSGNLSPSISSQSTSVTSIIGCLLQFWSIPSLQLFSLWINSIVIIIAPGISAGQQATILSLFGYRSSR